jgi:hypothetical protein
MRLKHLQGLLFVSAVLQRICDHLQDVLQGLHIVYLL